MADYLEKDRSLENPKYHKLLAKLTKLAKDAEKLGMLNYQ